MKAVVLVAVALCVGGAGCQRKSSAVARPPQGQWGQPPPAQGQWGQPPPAQGQWGQPPPAQGQWGQPPPAPSQPVPQQPPAPVPGPSGSDPINGLEMGFLRHRAGTVLAELVAALPEASRAKVQNVPLFGDPTVGEVNAFAACDDQRQPLMAVSDGLLEIMAFSARFKANDEIFGTRKLDAYTSLLVSGLRAKHPLPRPSPGFVDPGQDLDPRKIARQAQLLDAELAFVLGHELAHHHLGHTGCATGGGSSGVGVGDFGRILSRTLPAFSQGAEVSADVAGTNNLLAAGSRRQGAKWNEEGAVLSLGFFAALDRLTPEAILFSFEATHPPPALRIPIVQNTATTWRFTGGNPLPVLGF